MTAQPTPARARYIVAVLTVAYMYGFLNRMIVALLAEPIKHDLLLSDTQFGVLQGGAFGLLYTLLVLPFGRAADTGPRRSIIAACIAFWSLMTVACGLVRTFPALLLARLGVGAGEAGLNPSAISIIGDLFTRERIALPMAIYLSGIYLGAAVALGLAGPLVDWLTARGPLDIPVFGHIAAWRLTLILIGAPGLAFAAFVRFTLPEIARTSAGKKGDVEAATPSMRSVLAHVAQQRARYTVVFVGFILIVILVNAQLAWVPSVLVRRFGLSAGQVGVTYGAIFALGGLSGSLAVGRLASYLRRRWHGNELLRTAYVGAAGLALPAILGPISPNVTVALLLFGLAAFFIALVVSITPSVIVAMAPDGMRGQLTAIYLVCSGLLGHTLGPVFVGLINDRLFADPAKIGYSLALTALATIPASAWCLRRASMSPQPA